MARKPVRTRIEDLRRKELIEAAHRVFMQHGLSGMTTKRICEAAGMSPGILSYYFKGKEDVLFAMVRLNNRLLMEEVVKGLHRATTRWERLEAIIIGNFPTDLFEPNVANAWLSVCAASSTNARYARLQRVFYSRLQSNLASVFGGILPPDRFELVALALGSVIDGLWLRRATGEHLPPDAAIALVLTVAAALLSSAEHLALQQSSAVVA
jgi:transcriptional repressor BetI